MQQQMKLLLQANARTLAKVSCNYFCANKPLAATGEFVGGHHVPCFIVHLFRRYDWSHAVLFYDRNGHYNVGGVQTCHLLMSTLVHYFQQSNITHDYTSYTDLSAFNITDNLIRKVGLDHSSK